jgi:hypothetical protein
VVNHVARYFSAARRATSNVAALNPARRSASLLPLRPVAIPTARDKKGTVCHSALVALGILIAMSIGLLIGGAMLMTVPDYEGVVQGFGLLLIVGAAIAATMAFAEVFHSRRRRGSP